MSIVLHPQYITDEAGKRISVVLPIEEFEALTQARQGEDETAYLLGNPANARRLLESVANLRAGRHIERRELLPDD
jgi:PHD/YefM family antitoxin component YafN of YafNO toxin-antitoxin module